jgi:hypothetical protein
MQNQASPPRRKNLRRRVLIFPKFQVPVLLINLGVICIMAGIVWFGAHNAFSELRPAAGLSDSEREFFLRYLDYQERNFHRALFAALLVGLGVSTVLTLVVTHRFSGPLLRLRGYFKQLSERPEEGAERAPRLEFRDGDYLSDLPPLINLAVHRMESRDPTHKGKKAS